jgi:hypothetical protein
VLVRPDLIDALKRVLHALRFRCPRQYRAPGYLRTDWARDAASTMLDPGDFLAPDESGYVNRGKAVIGDGYIAQ